MIRLQLFPKGKNPMQRHTMIVALVVILGGIALFFLFPEKTVHEPPPAQVLAPAPEETRDQEPQYPAPAEQAPGDEPAEPLPALDESDGPAVAALSDLFGKEAIRRFLVPKNLARHAVTSIDNLPQAKLAMRLRPVQAMPGEFLVTGAEDELFLDPANFERYEPFISMLESVEVEDQLNLYWHFYPLLQQAYQELGYPEGHFNDRLVAVIDHLLAAPDIEGPIPLVRPKVFYEFADPQLQAGSAGHKILIRVGPENARRIKAWLQELRAGLTRESYNPDPGQR